jgi:hypothetical protein
VDANKPSTRIKIVSGLRSNWTDHFFLRTVNLYTISNAAANAIASDTLTNAAANSIASNTIANAAANAIARDTISNAAANTIASDTLTNAAANSIASDTLANAAANAAANAIIPSDMLGCDMCPRNRRKGRSNHCLGVAFQPNR